MIIDKYHESYNRITYGIFGLRPNNKKLIKLIKICKLDIDNLIVSTYLLYKLKSNSIISIDEKLIDKIIIMSLILLNKLLQDSNYSFKTWIKLFQMVKININLKLLNQLEILVLTGLDYNLEYKFIQFDNEFWSCLKLHNFNDYKLFNDYINCRPEDSPTTPMDSPLLQQQDTDYNYIMKSIPTLESVPTLPMNYEMNIMTGIPPAIKSSFCNNYV